MAWLVLFLAGLFEIGWPLGFKLASVMPRYHILFIILAVVSMGVSGCLLFVAQKSIPIGTAYAIWTGIGAVGTLVVGIVMFDDSTSMWRMLSAALIVMGIIGLKLSQQ